MVMLKRCDDMSYIQKTGGQPGLIAARLRPHPRARETAPSAAPLLRRARAGGRGADRRSQIRPVPDKQIFS